jgi:hypothetical protein
MKVSNDGDRPARCARSREASFGRSRLEWRNRQGREGLAAMNRFGAAAARRILTAAGGDVHRGREKDRLRTCSEKIENQGGLHR